MYDWVNDFALLFSFKPLPIGDEQSIKLYDET